MKIVTAIGYLAAGLVLATFCKIAARERLSGTAACPAIWALLREWRIRAVSRRELRSLSRREIADFCPGLTEVEQEERKPFWRA